MEVAPHAAAPEKRSRIERGHHAGRQAVGIMSVPDDLVDGRAARLGLALGRFGREGAGGTVEMRVDAAYVAAHLVHVAHDEQLVAQGLERLQHVLESFPLQWCGDAQPEKYIEGARWHGLRRRESIGGDHLLQQRQTDGDAAESLQEGAAIDGRFHSLITVWVVCTRSLSTIAVMRLV